MLNEKKVIHMTRLALYEEKNGKKAISSNKYYKNDYVGLNMVVTGIMATFAYCLILMLWVIANIDYLMDEITNLDLLSIGRTVLLIYVIYIVIFTFIAYVTYSMRYQTMKESNEQYAEDLKELYLIYKKEEKREEKKDARQMRQLIREMNEDIPDMFPDIELDIGLDSEGNDRREGEIDEDETFSD